MKYTIEKLKIGIDLEDKLVEKYRSIHDLSDETFMLVIKAVESNVINKDKISNAELSKICNSILVTEILLNSVLDKD